MELAGWGRGNTSDKIPVLLKKIYSSQKMHSIRRIQSDTYFLLKLNWPLNLFPIFRREIKPLIWNKDTTLQLTKKRKIYLLFGIIKVQNVVSAQLASMLGAYVHICILFCFHEFLRTKKWIRWHHPHQDQLCIWCYTFGTRKKVYLKWSFSQLFLYFCIL